ncbi:MAG TPA: hypothetical protein VGK33_22310 [Chloroflexota bacterium]|jgi:hypothetical protein
MHIDLTADETAVVTEILENARGDVREQIYKAELADLKDSLRQREAMLTSLLARLGVPTPKG